VIRFLGGSGKLWLGAAGTRCKEQSGASPRLTVYSFSISSAIASCHLKTHPCMNHPQGWSTFSILPREVSSLRVVMPTNNNENPSGHPHHHLSIIEGAVKNIVRIIPLALLLNITPLSAQTPKPCGLTFRLSDDEAQILLYVTPAAIAARQEGTDVDIERSEPTQRYPAVDFFTATLVSRKPTSGSVLGNGILGTFVVDRRTGEVESIGDFTPVKGKELDRIRGWLLHAHCTTK
jgi:hypothetical protein